MGKEGEEGERNKGKVRKGEGEGEKGREGGRQASSLPL